MSCTIPYVTILGAPQCDLVGTREVYGQLNAGGDGICENMVNYMEAFDMSTIPLNGLAYLVFDNVTDSTPSSITIYENTFYPAFSNIGADSGTGPPGNPYAFRVQIQFCNSSGYMIVEFSEAQSGLYTCQAGCTAAATNTLVQVELGIPNQFGSSPSIASYTYLATVGNNDNSTFYAAFSPAHPGYVAQYNSITDMLALPTYGFSDTQDTSLFYATGWNKGKCLPPNEDPFTGQEENP